jgi:hypothetical protein
MLPCYRITRIEKGSVHVGGVPRLSFGRSYLFWEGRGLRGYEAYVSHLRDGNRGLCISGTGSRLGLRGIPPESVVVRLSSRGDGPLVKSIHPRKPHKLLVAVREFLRSERGKIVLVEGMDSLLRHNGFEDVLQVLQGMNDEVALRRGIMIITVSRSRFSPRQMGLLEREFETVDDGGALLALLEAA